jgi:hypothetical protein
MSPVLTEEPGWQRAHSKPHYRGDHVFGWMKDVRSAATASIGKLREKSHVPLVKRGDSDLHRTDGLSPAAGNNPSRSSGYKKFVYQGLWGTGSFRLVKILPGNTKSLKCEIVHSSLLNPPDYVAISYAWGDGFDKRYITLEDDYIFTVNASLHDALMAVRALGRPTYVWIDGLSIDQGNKGERSSQVQLMDKIYRKATSVAIWLGPGLEKSDRAIRRIEELKDEIPACEWIESLDYDDYKALTSLFKREYWKRLWVVQEVYHARNKMVYCGFSKLSWDLCKMASDAVWQHESDSYLWTGPSSFPDVEHLIALGPNSLLEVLRACRRKLSENPRDKIFGVLGILPNDVRERLHIDYNKSVKSLYLDVVQLIVPSTRRLDVIREAIHFPVQVSCTDLPTWCPNWAQVPENSALSSKVFSAAGDSDAQYQFTDESRKLEISGIELGVIDTTGVAVGTLCSLQDYLMAFINWRMLLLSFFEIAEDKEPGHPILEDFCRTLSLGQVVGREDWSWAEVCFHVFASLIQERFPRLQLDREFQRHGDSGILQREEFRSFLQKHFGDCMVSTVS